MKVNTSKLTEAHDGMTKTVFRNSVQEQCSETLLRTVPSQKPSDGLAEAAKQEGQQERLIKMINQKVLNKKYRLGAIDQVFYSVFYQLKQLQTSKLNLKTPL